MGPRVTAGVVSVLLTGLLLAGCAFLPADGPSSQAITAEVSDVTPYAAVALNQATIDILSRAEPDGLAGMFSDRRKPASLKLGIGDVVAISIFEAASGGLFIPAEAGVRPGNFIALPEQAVDNDGNISVPYAGVIHASGHTTVEVQNTIVERIKTRAIDPQVVVSLSSQRTSLVSVMGEVNAPLRFAAAAAGAEDRITDALTRAGGIKGQGYESWVVLERNGKRATVAFETLIMSPANNVFVQPGDRIYVYREAQKFIAFGAAGQQGEFAFDAWRINLAEAVAKAGGLTDTQADPGSVFLYRREPKRVAALLNPEAAKIPGDTVPVIFRADLSDPGGYFLCTKLTMRNGDVLFVANAKEVQVSKFLAFLNLVTSTAANGAYAINAGYAVKANVAGRQASIITSPTVATTAGQ